jgi:peptide-methionine (S)-S-oxide reductase
MPRLIVRLVAVSVAVVAIVVALGLRSSSSSRAAAFPDPILRDSSLTSGVQIAVFAGGCFWGVEAVFEHMKGVRDAVSGYAGGTKSTADYGSVSSGATAHAEAVRVTFDPAVVSYAQLLKVFFSVVHDPTQLNRQGPDIGPQYRSAIFYGDADQERVARAYVKQLTDARTFERPIVTQLVPLDEFFVAEDYHQDYAAKHPNEPYIVFHDRPKVARLEAEFPELFRKIGM